MTGALNPYPRYKDSGESWLGDMPAHWPIRRLKSAARNVVEMTDGQRDGETYLALEHVESWTGRVRASAGAASFDSQVKRIQPDDVLFGKLRPYLAKVTRLPTPRVCVGEFLVLRVGGESLAPSYLEALLRSGPAIDAVNSSTFGAKMPRADWGFVGSMAIPLPPPDEQAAIVRYLDYMVRRIRRYIRAKQKLIKLVEEETQAIIHCAVTGQVDVRHGSPYPAYKPSGVRWLGDVPEQWQVRRCRYLLREVDERSRDGTEEHLSMSQRLGLVPSDLLLT